MGDTKDLNIFTQVPIPQKFGRIEKIATGANHNFIICEKNKFYACGYNSYDQLGINSTKN